MAHVGFLVAAVRGSWRDIVVVTSFLLGGPAIKSPFLLANEGSPMKEQPVNHAAAQWQQQ
jgi:hypothetical protein